MLVRRYSPTPVPTTLDGMVKSGSMDSNTAQKLGEAVRAGERIVVAGPTASGKTTVAGCLAVAAGTGRDIIAAGDGEEQLHRRLCQTFARTDPHAEESAVTDIIVAALAAAVESGRPNPLLLLDGLHPASPVVKSLDPSLQLVVTMGAGSASGAAQRLDALGHPLRPGTVVVWCPGRFGHRRVEASRFLGTQAGAHKFRSL